MDKWRAAVAAIGISWGGWAHGAEPALPPVDFEAAEHGYWENPPRDPFSAVKARIEDGSLSLDTSGETAYVRSLLRHLGIPESSQLLCFSTTSLQLAFISLEQPRAIFFNDDVYVGVVRGGRIEVISIDPELGAIFSIFDVPRRPDQPVVVERSDRCMNCHANVSTGKVPGVVIKSVLPGPNRGTIDTYRKDLLGHQVPLAERFGGWHVTGADGFTEHRGDRTGRYVDGEIVTSPVRAGQAGSLADYVRPGSDILPHLVFEHQAAFTNRLIGLVYQWRTLQAAGREAELNGAILDFLRYATFAEEAKLPPGGFRGDGEFRKEFAAAGKRDAQGRSLREFDLEKRIFRHRCSYLFEGRMFAGIPPELRQRILIRLRNGLDPRRADPAFAHLGAAEKQAIVEIVRATVPGLPKGW
jgi:hypothetical protein